MVHISSVRFNGLYWLGGTGHWFHFAERIIPMLSESYSKVWGPGALGVRDRDHSTLYIVFEERESVTSLGMQFTHILAPFISGHWP